MTIEVTNDELFSVPELLHVFKKRGSNGRTQYLLEIEGFYGYNSLEHCIETYECCLQQLENFLNKHHKRVDNENIESSSCHTIYKTRAIEIAYGYDCYWVYLDTYYANDIWDLYDYLKDVINQIRGFANFPASLWGLNEFH